MRLGSSWRWAVGVAAAAALCGSAGAQLLPPLPAPPPTPPVVGGTLGQVGRTADRTVGDVRGTAGALASARVERLEALVRANREALEMTDLGPAVRGEVIALDPDPASLAAAEAAGFTRIAAERIEGLGISEVQLRVPRGWSVDRALSRLRRIAPGGVFAANHLHGQSGQAGAAPVGAALLVQGQASGPGAVGIIDGGVATHPALRGAVRQRGFVAGAPRPNAHATAIASLIAGEGPVRGAAPGAPLLVADVYGSDPAGGNALALARALGWMTVQRVPVVAISLVGPANALVARAIGQAQARGVHVVAAVGNDGPAAPPAYPASYPGVIAVTGVDGRDRVLAEAGRASHLDYAAPGADMAAAAANGRIAPVRGTSFAVPFVAGRLAAHARAPRPIAALDAEATERGRRGVGRGVICGDCRTPYRR
ncbi:MAG TPA: S8 family serine peptidase [Allosphingosinicella sp.]|nr:S8 family serine peptidase [Allosphingosinicella sp.]